MRHRGLKKIYVILLAAVLLTACGQEEPKEALPNDSGSIKIVTTVFPPYDFLRRITGNKADIVMLLSPGMESHSYEPTPKDMIAIKECDLFVYGGGESDTWVEDLLEGIEDREGTTLKMMDCIKPLEEESLEGMQKQGSKGHTHEDIEYDEHVWTDPNNASEIVTKLVEELKKIDPVNQVYYEQNGEAYQKELRMLDADIREWRDKLTNPTLVFGDRFPFLYFAQAYDLTCYAAFPGCSSETEVSAKTMAFLIDQVRQQQLGAVFHLELSNAKVAEAIAEAGNTKTAMLHSCHNISKEEMEQGVTYLSLMRQNLEVLKEITY